MSLDDDGHVSTSGEAENCPLVFNEVAKPSHPSPSYIRISHVLVFGAAVALGFLICWYNFRQRTGELSSLGARTTLREFNFNMTFIKPPSPIINAAWEALLPSNGGYVKNPRGGSEQTGLSMFHQIHCLDVIRRVYYAAALNLEPDPSIEEPHRHALHCFDFLRQSLMCSGDMTIEFEDVSQGGITGIGTTHKCVDYDRIFAWAESQGMPE